MLEQQKNTTAQQDKHRDNDKKIICSYAYSNQIIEIKQSRKYKTILWVYCDNKLIGITSPHEIYKQVRHTYEEIDNQIKQKAKNG
jgi:hypothetical protein